jgi:hypothetical protein
MRRQPRSVEQLVAAAVAPFVARTATRMAAAVRRLVASRIQAEVGARGVRRRSVRRKTKPRAGVTKWTADRSARRVPNFVIEATGLETKREIVARYGEASFERGKSLPEALAPRATSVRPDAPAPVKAKGPIIRRKARPAA